MAYFPDSRVTVYPANANFVGGTNIEVLSFDYEDGDDGVARFEFEIPIEADDVYDNYADFVATLLQTGAGVDFLTTEDGTFGASAKRWFRGWIWEIQRDTAEGRQTRRYVCYDRLAPQRTVNVNVRKACRQLIYEFTSESSDWAWSIDPVDADFVVDLPDNGEDWVPNGCIYLMAYDDTGSTVYTHDYANDEYTFAAGKKQLIFHTEGGGEGTAGPPATRKSEGWIWVMRIMYYDPSDTTASVNTVLDEVLAGTPWSEAGGLGIGVTIDLDDITSFDSVSLKLARHINFRKNDGPAQGLLDAMRDSGLIPASYRISHDAAADDVKGRYLLQDNGAVYTMSKVLSDSQPSTLESVAGRVEHHGENANPRNYTLGGTVVARTDWLTNEDFTVYGDPANLVDGKAATFYQFVQYVTGLDYIPLATPVDMIVIDTGEVHEDIDRLHFRHTHPQKGSAGAWEDIAVRLILRMPRVTVSGSEYRITERFEAAITNAVSTSVFDVDDVGGPSPAPRFAEGDWLMVYDGATLRGGSVITNITGVRITISPAITGVANGDTVVVDNPGVPFGEAAANVVLDPTDVDDSGRDIDSEAEWLGPCRYVAVRWEQDCFFRSGTSGAPSPMREIWYGASEVKALGDEKLRYPANHTDEYDSVYVQITDKGTTVKAKTSDTIFELNSLTGIEGAWAANGEHIQLEDSLGAIHTGVITNVAASVITVDWDGADPTVNVGDEVGWRKRWQADFTGTYIDLYKPSLFRKLYNTSHWMEVLEDETAGDYDEAEKVCLERLLELISITRDHECEIALDHDVYIGRTVRTFADELPWLVTGITIKSNPPPETASDNAPPLVTMVVRGTNYDEAAE